MGELFKISINTLLNSLFEVLVYFILGILIDIDIITVFLITYLLQFLGSLISCLHRNNMIISNLHQHQSKEANNKLISQMIVLIFVYIIANLILIYNIDWYLEYMTPIRTEIVRTYTIYSVFDIMFNWIIWDLNKYYIFKNQTRTGNKMTLMYILASDTSVILLSIIINPTYAVIITIILKIVIGIYYIIKFIKSNKPKRFSIDIKGLLLYRVNALYCCIARTIIQISVQYGLTITSQSSDYIVLASSLMCTDIQRDLVGEIPTLYQIKYSNREEPLKALRIVKKVGIKFTSLLGLSSIVSSMILIFWIDNKISFILNIVMNIIAYTCDAGYNIEYFLIDVVNKSKILMAIQTFKYLLRFIGVSLIVSANTNIATMMIGEIIGLLFITYYFNNRLDKKLIIDSQNLINV